MIMIPSQDCRKNPDLDCLQSAISNIHTASISIFVGLRSDSPNFKLGILDLKEI